MTQATTYMYMYASTRVRHDDVTTALCNETRAECDVITATCDVTTTCSMSVSRNGTEHKKTPLFKVTR